MTYQTYSTTHHRESSIDHPARIKKCIEVFKKVRYDFLEDMATSFLKQCEKYGGLTARQTASLAKWEAEYCTPEAAKSLEMWEEDYKKSPKKRELFADAITHYSHARYFSNTVREYHKDPENFIPTISVFKRMTDNPYFQRWLREKNTIPRFKSGDMVEGRQGKREHAGALYIVTEVKTLIDPCKGGRWYEGHILKESPSWWATARYRSTKGSATIEFREKEVKPFGGRRKKAPTK